MSGKPYFTISRESFEKNAGYKTTVYALAELVDNAFEAEAKKVVIALMVDSNQMLRKIATIDNGDGMNQEILQSAVCEKAGTNFDRQVSSGKKARRKFGKYGVGLPKASLSQCNFFSVWSWLNKPENALKSYIDITDLEWINNGAIVEDPKKEAAPQEWLTIADMANAKSGTLVLWGDLDGLTWSRARWGEHSGLIPNLEFQLGRTYRKMLSGKKPDFEIEVVVLDERFREIEKVKIGPNDPLFITAGCRIPRKKLDDGIFWPQDDPLFDEIIKGTLELEIPLKNGKTTKKSISFAASIARKNTFAQLSGRNAGSLPHGKFADRNLGISLLREGREIDLSLALNNPSEARERWIGAEFDFPHEFDNILGMTNNKQSYTRLEQVIKHKKEDFLEPNETTNACLSRLRKEDPILANCLEIAWKIRDIWEFAWKTHKDMREEFIGQPDGDNGDPDISPEDRAEKFATKADNKGISLPKNLSEEEQKNLKIKIIQELEKQGVPNTVAKQIAARIVEKGLTYIITSRAGLGSPFFSVDHVVDSKILVLNQDHRAHPYLISSISEMENEKLEVLKDRLQKAKTSIMLMLEAWTKLESEAVTSEKRKFQMLREDWGRVLDSFIEEYEKEN